MKRAVICFTRVPKPGATKTRLLPVLKPQQCADLHWAFLKDLADTYREVDAHLFVAYTPDADWESLKTVFPHAGFYPQKGNDLGERMYRVIRKILELGYESAVLTGTDLPMMTAAHLESGFAVLEEKDIAIGPTSDGGYYLIGMKKPCREVFRVEGYGGASVFESTVTAAEDAGLSVGLALTCDDVDTPGDLWDLTKTVRPGSHTEKFLKQEGIG
ncbi:MAG: TIGR04282 family arsenosugar biosynthesis glycosyltransferase [Oscillospiraceae bacterium]|nr:TIGR04282 family arsenosugar biosynthesis glycosyltransferase [Oscillospiraceae bacterium]